MEELERLEEIKCRIHSHYRCIDKIKESIVSLEPISGWFPKLINNWALEIESRLRAIARYKKIFNQELDKLRYKGE